MKRLAIVTGILALAAPLALAQTSTWTSDPNHSEVDFSITHMTVSNIHGRFGHVNATIAYNEADVTKSTVNATIDVTGVDTGEEARNTHLKSPDFFDVATFPTATFTSTSVSKSGDGLTINGTLTLHGTTKPVVLSAEGPRGRRRAWITNRTLAFPQPPKSSAQTLASAASSAPPWWATKSSSTSNSKS